MRSLCLLVMTLTLVSAPPAQIGSGGNYALEKSVIAGGGNTVSGDAYLITGTAAQPTGFVSTGGSYGVRSGFWQPSLAPTAAVVSIGGRVTANSGGAMTQVFLTDMSGVTRSTFASSFGYYRFDGVEIGEIYILRALHKQYSFKDSPRVLMVLDELSDVDFIAAPIQ